MVEAGSWEALIRKVPSLVNRLLSLETPGEGQFHLEHGGAYPTTLEDCLKVFNRTRCDIVIYLKGDGLRSVTTEDGNRLIERYASLSSDEVQRDEVDRLARLDVDVSNQLVTVNDLGGLLVPSHTTKKSYIPRLA